MRDIVTAGSTAGCCGPLFGAHTQIQHIIVYAHAHKDKEQGKRGKAIKDRIIKYEIVRQALDLIEMKISGSRFRSHCSRAVTLCHNSRQFGLKRITKSIGRSGSFLISKIYRNVSVPHTPAGAETWDRILHPETRRTRSQSLLQIH
jgi:hypothetical protein